MDDVKSVKISIPEGYEIDKENSTFETIVFKKIKNQFSKTWEDFCDNNNITANESFIDVNSNINQLKNGQPRYYNTNKNHIPSKFAESILALMQLLIIREKEYTKGWEPDWTNKHQIKYSLIVDFDIIVSSDCRTMSTILSFPTEELRNEFYDNWKDLIEIAKPLL